jgi:hypothetical protein
VAKICVSVHPNSALWIQGSCDAGLTFSRSTGYITECSLKEIVSSKNITAFQFFFLPTYRDSREGTREHIPA